MPNNRLEYQRYYYKLNKPNYHKYNRNYLDKLKKNPIKWERHTRKKKFNYIYKMYLENLFEEPVEPVEPAKDKRQYYKNNALKPKPYLVRTHKEITLTFD